MNKVDWSKAPDGATHYGGGSFWIDMGSTFGYRKYKEERKMFDFSIDKPQAFTDYEARPQKWPESDERVDIIGTNGNDGQHYGAKGCKLPPMTGDEFIDDGGWVELSAATILQEGLSILSERGKQYGSEGEERSFPQVAQAFTALTGKELVGSDVCLILALVKQVRQYAQPRYHHDSAVDGVNYLALQAEELQKERL